MFLVDKYYNDPNYLSYYETIIDKIISSFDNYKNIYKNVDSLIKLPNNKFREITYDLEHETYRFSNFQHLIIYGIYGTSKEYLINKLLEKIYGRIGIEVKEVEYIISGYSNTKTKILIKQSKKHIIIEPNSNGFDKYLIQEIIQEYAKSEMLNILKHKRLFKIVIINKIDNLSYYAQASLRRTMEKYSNTCKFILVSNQLSKISEPLRSRCLLIRIPLPSDTQILQTILYICEKENTSIPFKDIYNIIKQSDNIVNHIIWLIEMYKYNITYENNVDIIINDIINMILYQKLNTNKKLYMIMKKIKEKFYLLFITNIPTQTIIRKVMINLLGKLDNIMLKFHIIEITAIFEQRLNQGTRHIIQIEAYVIRLIYLFNNLDNIYYNLIEI